jgi:putative addiction module killer protein
LHDLRDAKARTKILVRIQRLADGNPGDVGPVGEGVSELAPALWPGLPSLFCQPRRRDRVLLCGGDKSSQARDIETAKRLAITEE